jgi:HK97 gp10 family phage protein
MGLGVTASFRAGNTAAVISRVAAGATQGVLNAAQAGQAISQAIVPVRTGALRDDITVKQGADDSSAWAAWGPDSVRYRFYVEYGTGKRGAESPQAGPGPYRMDWPGMTPRPYMRPALDEIQPQVLDIVADAVKSVL